MKSTWLSDRLSLVRAYSCGADPVTSFHRNRHPPSRSGQSPVYLFRHGVPPFRRRAFIRRMYFPLADQTLQLTSNQSREDLSPFLSSGSPPPPPHPAPAPSNADIEAVIQMATSKQGRLPIPKDTRTQLFVGNVRSSSLILFSSLTEIAASLSSSLAGP